MSWVVYTQCESALRGKVNYNSQLALNASTLVATADKLVVRPEVDPKLALSLCEDKLSLGLLGAGRDSLKDKQHTCITPKVTAAFCLAHILYTVKHFLHIFGVSQHPAPEGLGQ